MSGVVKSVKKVFRSVVNVVKKIWRPLLIAAAVYFTAGLALSAFPATASFAASMPGFAGGGALGTGIGGTAGTGIFSTAAAKMGLGALGAHGGLAGGAMAAGTSAAALGQAGFSAAAVGEAAGAVAGGSFGAGAGASATLASANPASIVAGTGPTTASPALTTGESVVSGAISGGKAAAAGGMGGMTLGEKLLLASSGTQALGVLMGEDPADAKKWQGSFFGVQYSGDGPGPTEGGPTTGMPDPANKVKLADTGKPAAPNLFEQQVQGKPAPAPAAPAPQSSGDLFQAKNPKVRYV